MANVTKIEKTIKVVLELSEEEAEVLKFVLCKVGGSEKSKRVLTSGIWRELDRCGVKEIRPPYRVRHNHNPECDTVFILEDEAQ